MPFGPITEVAPTESADRTGVCAAPGETGPFFKPPTVVGHLWQRLQDHTRPMTTDDQSAEWMLLPKVKQKALELPFPKSYIYLGLWEI